MDCSNKYLIKDNLGCYVVGYVDTKYIAYSSQDRFSIDIIQDYTDATEKIEILKQYEYMLLNKGIINDVHTFYIIEVWTK